MKGVSGNYVIGIDEVGRGALAGPVVVAAALVPAGHFRDLKDSKKLTPARREAWCAYFKNCGDAAFATARVYPRGIERMNISRAANRAAARAVAALSRNYGVDIKKTSIFLDGGLYLGSRSEQRGLFPNAATVIKGDEKVPAVAAASIIAKVSRDRFMAKLARRWPAYSFEVHKGYGTKIHLKALAKAGPCEAHRLTFLAQKPILNGN